MRSLPVSQGGFAAEGGADDYWAVVEPERAAQFKGRSELRECGGASLAFDAGREQGHECWRGEAELAEEVGESFAGGRVHVGRLGWPAGSDGDFHALVAHVGEARQGLEDVELLHAVGAVVEFHAVTASCCAPMRSRSAMSKLIQCFM